MRKFGNYVWLAAIVAVASIATVKLFGTTVSQKFNHANQTVMNEVVFGDGPSYAPRGPVFAARPAKVHVPIESPDVALTRDDALSTFSIDVDTGSYTLARRALEGGWAPDPQAVRVEEFVNYFRYDYAMPPLTRTGSVHMEAAPSPFSTTGRTHLLRIGLQARALRDRVPVHVTFLVDTSGSMQSRDRLPLAQQSILTTVAGLQHGDQVAIATYAGSTSVVLESTPVEQLRAIRKAVDSLKAHGGTAMSSGMELAYQIAAQHAGERRVSRVVVLSDGDANIGRIGSADMLTSIRSYADEGVTLSTVGFGTGNYNDRLMEQLADAGNGNYTYIDSAAEIPLVFGDRLDSLLHVVAKDVKVQVEFNPEAVTSWRQIGYENRQLADREFRDDRVDAGEMGAGHQVTALYEVTLGQGVSPAETLATVRFRHKEVGENRAQEASTEFAVGVVRGRIGDTSDDFRFQAAVAAFALSLRGDEQRRMDWIEEVARTATAGRAERASFLKLVRRAAEQRGEM